MCFSGILTGSYCIQRSAACVIRTSIVQDKRHKFLLSSILYGGRRTRREKFCSMSRLVTSAVSGTLDSGDRNACIAVPSRVNCVVGVSRVTRQTSCSKPPTNVVEELLCPAHGTSQQPWQMGTRPIALTRYYGRWAGGKVE
jgi:hypothetical protein